MKVSFTLEIPVRSMCQHYHLPGFLNFADPKNPTEEEMKEAAKLFYYELGDKEDLFNCPIENISLDLDSPDLYPLDINE